MFRLPGFCCRGAGPLFYVLLGPGAAGAARERAAASPTIMWSYTCSIMFTDTFFQHLRTRSTIKGASNNPS